MSRPYLTLALQMRPRRLGSRLASPRFKPILGNRGGTGRLGGRYLYSGQFSVVSEDSYTLGKRAFTASRKLNGRLRAPKTFRGCRYPHTVINWLTSV